MHNLFYDAVVQIDAGSEAHHALLAEAHHHDLVHQGCPALLCRQAPGRGGGGDATRLAVAHGLSGGN